MAIIMAKFSMVKRVNPNFHHEIWLWNVNLTNDYEFLLIPRKLLKWVGNIVVTGQMD